MKSGSAEKILVVASEIMSRTLDWDDRRSCILWGDGAGAAILGNGELGPELLSTHIHTDGEMEKICYFLEVDLKLHQFHTRVLMNVVIL